MEQVSKSNLQSKSNLPWVFVIVVTVIVVAAVLYWLLVVKEKLSPEPILEPPVSETIESPDLGSELFERGSNPVGGELPETVAPVPNPLENIYENPF